jgi:hypothetical protein
MPSPHRPHHGPRSYGTLALHLIYGTSFLASNRVPFLTILAQIVCLVDTLVSITLYLQGFAHHNTRKWFYAFPPRPLLAFFSRSSSDAVTNLPYWYRPHLSPTKLPILFIRDIGNVSLRGFPPQARRTGPRPLGSSPFRCLSPHHPSHVMPCAPPSCAYWIFTDYIVSWWDILRHSRCRAPPTETARHDSGKAQSNHHRRRITRAWGTPTNANEPIIAAVLLINPIPFLVHHPAVTYNFVYRYPRHVNEWQLRYFASRDPDIARSLAPQFF